MSYYFSTCLPATPPPPLLLSISLSDLSICMSVCLPFFPNIHLPVGLTDFLSDYHLFLFVCLSVSGNPPISPTDYLCLISFMSVLSVCLSVCHFMTFISLLTFILLLALLTTYSLITTCLSFWLSKCISLLMSILFSALLASLTTYFSD